MSNRPLHPLLLLRILQVALLQPRIRARTAPHLILLTPHLPRIPPVTLQIRAELQVLLRNSILPDMRQEEKRQRGAKDTQSGRDEERILARANAFRSTGRVGLDDGEDVGADKGADLAHGGGDTVVLASNGGCGCFGCDEADVIARADFTKGKKDSIYDDEAADVRGGV